MTTLPAWAARLLRRELKFVESGFEFNKEAAEKLLALLAPRRKNEKQRAGAKGRREKKAGRREGTAALRVQVFQRPGPDCELAQHEWPRFQVELHHLRAGSAKQATEAIENCLRACFVCHRLWHRDGPAIFVRPVKQWAERHGYPLPSIIRKAEASAQLPGRAAR
jgi:hypothetical protein